jgi:hypothetical protein
MRYVAWQGVAAGERPYCPLHHAINAPTKITARPSIIPFWWNVTPKSVKRSISQLPIPCPHREGRRARSCVSTLRPSRMLMPVSWPMSLADHSTRRRRSPRPNGSSVDVPFDASDIDLDEKGGPARRSTVAPGKEQHGRLGRGPGGNQPGDGNATGVHVPTPGKKAGPILLAERWSACGKPVDNSGRGVVTLVEQSHRHGVNQL